ncbi:MAG: hypothetical protein JKX85_03475 [Phycisphaeraceae bacterium]|nr:hypothetical protein [Phycisphaeraceae bacterium]
MKTILPILLTLTLCNSLLSQTTQQPMQVQRIDQAVADLDGLSRSMRQQGSGLRIDGEHTSLYTIPKEKLMQLQVLGQAAQLSGVQRTNAYLRIAPGIMSQSDQTNYLVTSRTSATGVASNVAPALDGLFIETLPANTVFILSPELKTLIHQANMQRPSVNPAMQSNALTAQRVENKIDRRVKSNRVNNRQLSQRVDNRVSNLPHQTLRYQVHALRVPAKTPSNQNATK